MRASQRAKVLASKKGLKRVGFKRKVPQGTIYYTNSNAKPVQGNYFGLENIEQLVVRGFVKEPWNLGELRGKWSNCFGESKIQRFAPSKNSCDERIFSPITTIRRAFSASC